jgi:methionyl-tRNA synthetase
VTKCGAPLELKERKRYYRKLESIKNWIRSTLHSKPADNEAQDAQQGGPKQ